MKTWFDVDRKGLEKLQGRRGAEFMLFELIQNAWDQTVTEVKVTLTPVPGRPLAELTVEDDDLEGFLDISHAFTLFAESHKKDQAEKRGRFNFGEKLVLARCESAEIISTKHAIRFDDEGRRMIRDRTEKGTIFKAVFRCKHGDIADIEMAALRLLVPSHIKTSINGRVLPSRTALKQSRGILPTETADSQGVLKRTTRQTCVSFYRPVEGESAWLYEMGIPVCPHNGKYHYDIGQKIPVGLERDTVSQGYLDKLHAMAFNALYDEMGADDATSDWVKASSEAPGALPAAVNRYMDLAFGEKRVAYDPSDREANKIAVSEGYTVVSGGMLSKTAWNNAKAAGAILPAGQVTPSPKPYSDDGPPLNLLPLGQITPDMNRIEALAKKLAKALFGKNITVTWAMQQNWGVLATFGPSGKLVFNVADLGKSWLTITEPEASEEVLSLLIHEFGHHYESDHLSRSYYDALTSLGGRLARLVAKDPSIIRYE